MLNLFRTLSSKDIVYNTDMENLFNAFSGLESQRLSLGGLTITPAINGSAFNVTNSAGTNVFSVNTTTSSVGIGTTTPNARLDLGTGYGANGVKLLIYNDNTSSELAGTKVGFYMDNFVPNNVNFIFTESAANPGLFTICGKDIAGTTLNRYFEIAGLTGNIKHNAYTSLGTGNPSIKIKKLTGTTAAAEGGTTTVAHGLTGAKILGWTSKVEYGTNSGNAHNDATAGYRWDCYHDGTNFTLRLSATESESVLSKPFIITIIYEE